MTPCSRRRILAAAALVVFAACSGDALPTSPAEASPETLAPAAVAELGTLGGADAEAAAINAAGQVVGTSLDGSGDPHAFLWSGGEMRDLGTLGGSRSVAVDINDRSQIVGHSTTADGDTRAFLWTDGRMIDLGTLGGATSRAVAVNGRGDVLGVAEDDAGRQRAFLWSDGEMRRLASGGASDYEPFDLNERDRAIGREQPDSGGSVAVLWNDDGLRSLATSGSRNSEAIAINDRDQVLVTWRTPSLDTRSSLWTEGTHHEVPSLGGGTVAAAALNASGAVVGQAATEDRQTRAFLWSDDGPLRELGSLDASTSSALDLNDGGVVAGVLAGTPAGDFRAFAWRNGRMISMGPPPGPDGADGSMGIAVNADGVVLGLTRYSDGSIRSFLWRPDWASAPPPDAAMEVTPGAPARRDAPSEMTRRVLRVLEDGEGNVLPRLRETLREGSRLRASTRFLP